MKVPRCKGSRDLSPQEMSQFRYIESTFQEHCQKWGYEEVRTPTLEYLHLFTSTGTLTPSRLGKVYSFLDWDGWSGERIVLRPDGTIPVARLYVDSMEDQELARLFYVTNVFSYEQTGTKTRERWQCGAELMGSDSWLADVELMLLALETLQGLGLDNTELKLSHAGVIKAYLACLGIDDEERGKLFDKILDGNSMVLDNIKTDKSALRDLLPSLFMLNGKSSGFLKNIRSSLNHNLTEFGPSFDNFITITDLLERLDLKYIIDITSGRGFEYYTGIMFRFSIDGEEVGGGGRYNNLIPLLSNRDTPASGFALYLDQLMPLIDQPKTPTSPIKKILLRNISEKLSPTRLINAAKYLREAGYITSLSLNLEIRPTFHWLLDMQQEKMQFTLTNLVTGSQCELSTIDEVLAKLREENVP